MVISKEQSKNHVTFDKNRNVFCHIAEYCHNSCSKCPPFAAHMREDVHATHHLHCQMCHAKDAENAVSVHNTCLDKILCYLQRLFNRNWKLKQQVCR